MPARRFVAWIMRVCGLYIATTGVVLFCSMLYSIYNPESALLLLIGQGHYPLSPLAGSSWAQVALTFGMHSYADFFTGTRMMEQSYPFSKPLHRLACVWNSTRFVISFLWLLKIFHGFIQLHGVENEAYLPPTRTAWVLVSLLAVDALLVRPLSVFAQRIIEDVNGKEKYEEIKKFSKLTTIQKCCKGVFFYEAVLSGCSGAVYFVFPELFTWLYGYPTAMIDTVTLWCLSQFGVLVMTFGLYQMNADIDDDAFMVFQWLALDYVWMFIYWKGTAAVLGAWNPFTGTGANFWCHSAFHADSTLALARMVYLWTLLPNDEAQTYDGNVVESGTAAQAVAGSSLSDQTPGRMKRGLLRAPSSNELTEPGSTSKSPGRPRRKKIV
jgi:hypothetical protein